MGTFYDVRCMLVLTADARASWLAATVEAVEPWTSEPTSVRALLAALERGDAPINGHLVGSLPVRVTAAEITWSWKTLASEVAPEIIRASRALWQASVPFAGRGVWGYRDALGPETLWDSVCTLVDGRVLEMKEMIPLFGHLLSDDAEATTPSVDCVDDILF